VPVVAHRSVTWSAWSSIWLALMGTSAASLAVLWSLSWTGAEDAVVAALADQLVAEASLLGAHLEDVPVEALVALGGGHAIEALSDELDRLTAAAGLHDAALLGPGEAVLGSDGGWLTAEADADLLATARGGSAVAGPLYRAEDGALYLAAYAPLPGRPGWVVAVEGSATLGAVDRLARQQLGASAVVLVAVGVFGVVAASVVSRPLRALQRDLARIRPGDPPEPLVASGPREVVEVASAVRALLAAIVERDGAVRQAHQQQLDDLTRLAAAVAHEVRNPLNAMALSIDRLVASDDPQRRRPIGDRLAEQVRELEELVGRLLDLTRPICAVPQELELPALARQVSAEVDVPVRWSGPEQVTVRADPGLVTQILRNLLLNARQAGAGTVELEWQGDRALLVRDDGPGLSDPAGVFDWFHTTRASGSGVGLPVSRRMAEAGGGRLELVSARPATFRLVFGGDR
jgi:signal transduction histidine kinase